MTGCRLSARERGIPLSRLTTQVRACRQAADTNYTSDWCDNEIAARSRDEPSYLALIAGKNQRPLANGYRHHNGIDHIRSFTLAQQSSCFMRFGFAKRNDCATGQKTPKLRLLRRPADLSQYRSRDQRNYAKFQSRFVFCPDTPVIPVRCHENGSIVENAAHAKRRTVRFGSCARTLRRASSISSGVKGPCCFSQSDTAAKPARRCKATRAAWVIQAETLTLSRMAAASISS